MKSTSLPIIRTADLSDAEEIARIHVDSWPLADSQSPSYEQRLELWYHLLGGGIRRTQVWVALSNLGELQGFAAAGRARVLKDRFDGELTMIYVARGAQRRGIGRVLLREVFAWFKASEFRSAMAWVPEACEARGFLARMGALELGEKRVVGQAQSAVSPIREIAMAWPTLA